MRSLSFELASSRRASALLEKRLEYTATHVLTEHGLLAAAVLELAVDKSYGTSINRQWVIPEDKVIITGVFTHLLPWTSLYAKGYLGWYVVHETAFTDVKQIDNADWWHPETSDID